MPKLLYKISANPFRCLELFPAKLFIYDDRLYFKDKGIIIRRESTLSYSQVSQVSINKGILHATIEIVNTGGSKNIKIDHVPLGSAIKAKELIEKIVQKTHQKGKSVIDPMVTLQKLQILKNQGILTEDEFQAKKRDILASL